MFLARMRADAKLLCPPQEKADRELTNQATVVEYLAYLVKQGRTRIPESIVLEIHRLTIDGIYTCAGNYRDAGTKIEIIGTGHAPAHPSKVQSEVRDMLDWLYDGGQDASPVRRAAYTLWKVNAIHPFNGGNGRVARALAYLVILLEVAPVFAGEPLPTKLKARKEEYLNALQEADKGDLAPLEQLVLECFRDQLADIEESATKRKKRPRRTR